MKSIAVIGGGIFGATVARDLGRAGCKVELFEQNYNLLLGATSASQGRLHRGYHYPRSAPLNLSDHARLFRSEFPEAVSENARHIYAIAREGSHTSASEFTDFCTRLNLAYDFDCPEVIRSDSVSLSIRAMEALINVDVLRSRLIDDLAVAGVRVLLQSKVDPAHLSGYDWVVDARYGNGWHHPLVFEVCETVGLRMPASFQDLSLVIMDGPFLSLDPVPGQNYHSLYHVNHSVHATNRGNAPAVPSHLLPLIDRGLVRTSFSRVSSMLRSAAVFLRGLEQIEYLGSKFAVRAVLPNVEHTDERPTIVHQQDNHVSILSGKIDMCVWAAQRTCDLILG